MRHRLATKAAGNTKGATIMDMFQATEATDWALKSYEQQLALAERDRLPRDWGRSAKPRNSKKREFDLRLQLAAAMAMLLVAMLAAVSI